MGTNQVLEVGNIIPFEAKVAEAVANDEYATIDLKNVRNILAQEPFQLAEDFIQQYEGKEPEWGELGWFTFKRTYARRVDHYVDGVLQLNEHGEPKSIRTEEWTEVVRRVVEGNLSMIQEDPLVTQAYGQRMFDQIWNLIWTPPGRGLWVSGTPFSRRTGDAYNNCWFVETRPYHYGETNKIFSRYTIDPYEPKVSYPFVFLFDQAMKGGGVGFSVEEHIVAEIPKIQNKANVYFYLDPHHPDFGAIQQASKHLGFSLNEDYDVTAENVVELTVADSREGWAEAYAVVIDEHFRKDKQDVTILLDMTEVREKGRQIKGFGGIASGSLPLIDLLHFTNTLLNKRYGQSLSSVDATDMHNATGKAVVAGNVRRTAEVGLASPKDDRFINMKNYKLVEYLAGYKQNEEGEWVRYEVPTEDLLEQGYTEEEIERDRYTAWAQDRHRWASNNSITIDEPRVYDFGFVSPAIETNGEPGIFNRFLAQNFGRIIDGYQAKTDKATGGNPCMEISLESGEPCNLAELMLPVMWQKGYDPSEVLPLMVHYTKRVTFSSYDWERSTEVIRRNRRIGISLSGFMDWVLLRFGKGAIEGWKVYNLEDWHDQVWLEDDRPYDYVPGYLPPAYDYERQRIEPYYNQALVAELDRMYKIVVQADIEYSHILSKALGYTVEPSVKKTTVKPSGTVSLLPGVSPGVHAHYFRYGIRRIRVQSNDPLLGMVQLANFKTEPSVQNPGSHVIEFPFRAPTADHPDFRDESEITIEEQFALQNLLNVYWADNMVSCTITFHEEEKPKIKHLLEQYRMRIKSTSLFPYRGHGYVQAPYEPFIEKDGKSPKEQYEERMKDIYMKPHELYKILMEQGKLEDRQMDLAEAVECQGGVCPVK